MKPHQLTPLIPAALVARWRTRYTRTTCYKRASALRRVLQFISTTTGIHALAAWVPKVPAPQPRTNIATSQQLDTILTQAEPWFRCFLLLCADLALRSGTAARVAPQHYFPESHLIRVDTKGGTIVELPVPPPLAALFESAPDLGDPTIPYWKLLKGPSKRATGNTRATLEMRWRRLKKQLALPDELHFHDLRRTAAVRLMDTTLDIRAVSHLLGHQSITSTALYLAHRDVEKLRTQLAAHWWTPRAKEPVQ